MAGLLKTAVIAVSTTVVQPSLPNATPQWTAQQDNTLEMVVGRWAESAGQPKPEIDPAVAQYRIGNLTLTAGDYCSATAKLVASLGYAKHRPAMAGCGSADQPLRIVSRAAN